MCREPQGPASTGLGVILGTVPSMLSQSPGRSRTTVNGRSLNPTGIQLESPGPHEPQQPRMWPLQQSARPTQECSSHLQHHHTQVRPGTASQDAERKKAKGKKVASAPAVVKKQEAKKVVNPLCEKNVGIRQDIQPKGTSPALSNGHTTSGCCGKGLFSLNVRKCLPRLTSLPRPWTTTQ
ncbi:hypothetical protein VULLAG_LOCUS9785 [Vulpes lagopus]